MQHLIYLTCALEEIEIENIFFFQNLKGLSKFLRTTVCVYSFECYFQAESKFVNKNGNFAIM